MMKLDEIEKLIDALIIDRCGWSGEPNGPMHKRHQDARNALVSRNADLMAKEGVCANCGHPHRK